MVEDDEKRFLVTVIKVRPQTRVFLIVERSLY